MAATKSRGKSPKKQPRKSKKSRKSPATGELGAKALKAARASLDLRARPKNERNAEYRRREKLLKEYGLYSPTSGKLTFYKKTTINKKYRELVDLLEGGAFAPYPTKSTKQRNQIKRAAKKVGARATKKGIFLGREEKEMNQPKGKLRFDKSTGNWEIVTEKRYYEKGKLVRRVTEHRPLTGMDALSRSEAKLRKRLDKLNLKPNQRIQFIIQGRNVSKQIWSAGQLDHMFRYMEGYRFTDRGRITFMESLTFEVIEKVSPKKKKWKGNAKAVKTIKA